MHNAVVWFTGLSGSGKTTIATALRDALAARGHRVVLLDGDDMRRGLCDDLGFSFWDVMENTRRIAEVARVLYLQTGFTVLITTILPNDFCRSLCRLATGGHQVLIVYTKASFRECMKRDPKGLYAKLGRRMLGATVNTYEPPTNADLTIDTTKTSVRVAVRAVMALLNRRAKSCAKP